jgi:hypothetical protein
MALIREHPNHIVTRQANCKVPVIVIEHALKLKASLIQLKLTLLFYRVPPENLTSAADRRDDDIIGGPTDIPDLPCVDG